MIVALNKPCGVLSRFTPDGSPNATLAAFGLPAGVYPIGRLDADSEGLLLLSDEPEWNALLLRPGHGHVREYWVQVEGEPSPEALRRLSEGVLIQGTPTRPARAWLLDPPPLLPPRNPPVRFRKTVPDTWIALELSEGRNRQVRRMTAAVGHPTLRLWRAAIGPVRLGDVPQGHWRPLNPGEIRALRDSLARPRPPARPRNRPGNPAPTRRRR